MTTVTLTPDQVQAVAGWAKDADSDYPDNDITIKTRVSGWVTVSQHHDAATFDYEGARVWKNGRDINQVVTA